MSEEDMRSVKKTTTFLNGYYSIGLPLKNDKLPLPNNKSLMEQRMASLRRKFKKDPKFYEDNKSFMDDVIKKGYAIQAEY